MSLLLRKVGIQSQASARPVRRAPCIVPRAQAQAGVAQRKPEPKKPQDAILAFSEAINLPTDEGLFGFRPFSEVCAVWYQPVPFGLLPCVWLTWRLTPHVAHTLHQATTQAHTTTAPARTQYLATAIIPHKAHVLRLLTPSN